jgi:putative membrane protein
MMKKLDPAIAASLSDAVRAAEKSSSAELVVEVRPRSGSYAHAEGRFAAVISFGALLFVLFSPWTFEPEWVPVGVLFAYIFGVAVARSSDFVRRLMTTHRDRESRLRAAAAAAFVERGVGNTRRETGLLVYFSMLERRIELIADRGILNAVPNLEWNQVVAAARERGATVEDLAAVVIGLQAILARYLPAAADDVDELSNEVRFVSE